MACVVVVPPVRCGLLEALHGFQEITAAPHAVGAANSVGRAQSVRRVRRVLSHPDPGPAVCR